MPSSDPYIARNTSGPGYSGTNTISRKDAPVESTFKIGQALEGQTTPLTVNGKSAQNKEEGKYEGKSWNGDTPVYAERMAVPEGTFRAATEYQNASPRGLNMIKEHEGNGAGPPSIPGGVFENACKTDFDSVLRPSTSTFSFHLPFDKRFKVGNSTAQGMDFVEQK